MVRPGGNHGCSGGEPWFSKKETMVEKGQEKRTDHGSPPDEPWYLFGRIMVLFFTNHGSPAEKPWLVFFLKRKRSTIKI
jgi:hypothetical protein